MNGAEFFRAWCDDFKWPKLESNVDKSSYEELNACDRMIERYRFMRAVAMSGELQRMVIFTMLDQCHTQKEFDTTIDKVMAKETDRWINPEYRLGD